MNPFQRVPDGIAIRLPEGLADWLSDLPELLDSLDPDEDDPAVERLSVPVYLDDAAANEEWWRLMSGELDQARAADRSCFVELVEAARTGTTASEAEAEAFLRVLVEGRLTVAARLRVEVEEDYQRLAEPEAIMLQALGELQVLLLRELE